MRNELTEKAHLNEQEREILVALGTESPWRFSNGIVEETVRGRFGVPYEALNRLVSMCIVVYEFYGTGAIHEFKITEAGRLKITTD